MVDVKLISMNYENACGYLCFCCADAVDCGVGVLDLLTLTFDSSPIKGEGVFGWFVLFTRTSGALWIPAYAGMTVLGWLGCLVVCPAHPSPLD